MRSVKLLPATAVALLILVTASGLILPVKANGQVRSASVELQTVEIPAGSTFSAQIWLRNLDPGYMTRFRFTIRWDPSMLEFISRTLTLVQDWSSTSETIESDYYVLYASGPLYNPDASWVTLTFRCLGAGTTQIVPGPGVAVIWNDGAGQGCASLPGTVNQHAAAVGGAVYDMKKLAILSVCSLVRSRIVT